MSYGQNMDPDIERLIQLLRKILKKHPQGSDHLAKMLEQSGINLNLCFLTFIPMTPDEMDELSEIYEDYLHRGELSAAREDDDVKLEFRLTNDDADFLKKNGIQF